MIEKYLYQPSLIKKNMSLFFYQRYVTLRSNLHERNENSLYIMKDGHPYLVNVKQMASTSSTPTATVTGEDKRMLSMHFSFVIINIKM